MGCDYYADENGGFEMMIIDHKTGKLLQVVAIQGLEPNRPLSRNIVRGSVR